MRYKEFTKARSILGKTRKQLAQILCVSPRTVQSFEQGSRNIPVHIERDILLLLSLKNKQAQGTRSCWNITNCPIECKANCIVWELKAGHICWFVSGTYCHGQIRNSWEDKIEVCRECDVYKKMFE